jgi:hypothetical protein
VVQADGIGIYDDRKDTFVRELDGKREELDGMAARYATPPPTLQADKTARYNP